MKDNSRWCTLILCTLGCFLYTTQTHAITSDSINIPAWADTISVAADSTSEAVYDSILMTNRISADSTLKDSPDLISVQASMETGLKDKKKEKELDPESYHAKRAAKWGILPGGGQIYNKRWWKVPIAWAMIGAGGFFIYNSASNMRTYNKALDMRNSGQTDEFAGVLSEQQIVSYRNLHRRNLQLSVFGTVGLWTLTILDAVVDAHLKTYDISDNLSIKFKPKVLRVYNNSVPSLSITLYL